MREGGVPTPTEKPRTSTTGPRRPPCPARDLGCGAAPRRTPRPRSGALRPPRAAGCRARRCCSTPPGTRRDRRGTGDRSCASRSRRVAVPVFPTLRPRAAGPGDRASSASAASVPVPRALWFETDPRPPRRAPFFVMERVDGRVPARRHALQRWQLAPRGTPSRSSASCRTSVRSSPILHGAARIDVRGPRVPPRVRRPRCDPASPPRRRTAGYYEWVVGDGAVPAARARVRLARRQLARRRRRRP